MAAKSAKSSTKDCPKLTMPQLSIPTKRFMQSCLIHNRKFSNLLWKILPFGWTLLIWNISSMGEGTIGHTDICMSCLSRAPRLRKNTLIDNFWTKMGRKYKKSSIDNLAIYQNIQTPEMRAHKKPRYRKIPHSSN